ncbi:site-2 protease family protein [Ahniella affigens]|uniref:Site-2 protease family protein n=2 Tax=Ahniella affigens TaxID=2021234 RepID=A0A2P1PP30_9GAMM|nr:site-2 protease family protein [Ahniella affigens]
MTFLFVLFLWIFSVCLHEFAHAAVAYRGGDHTVRDKGYLSLNPMNYLHPVNSVLFPVLILIMGGIGLPGAAVYIERHRLRSREWESAVSLAGPAANLILLAVLALAFKVPGVASHPIAPALAFLGLLQASAILINLLPIPGLDGYGAISPYLPPALRAKMDQFAAYGILILLGITLFGPTARILFGLVYLLTSLFGIPGWLIGIGYDQFTFWK